MSLYGLASEVVAVVEELELGRRKGHICFWCARSARWIRSRGMGEQQGACAEHVDDDPAWWATSAPDSVDAEFVVRVGSGIRDGRRVWVAEASGMQRLGRTPQDALASLATRMPQTAASPPNDAATERDSLRNALVRIAVYARGYVEFETERGMEGAARVWRHVWSTATEPLDEKTVGAIGDPP